MDSMPARSIETTSEALNENFGFMDLYNDGDKSATLQLGEFCAPHQLTM
jgi:hypothetical protein